MKKGDVVILKPGRQVIITTDLHTGKRKVINSGEEQTLSYADKDGRAYFQIDQARRRTEIPQDWLEVVVECESEEEK